MYDPIWSAENAADEVDRKFLSQRACKDCGFVMENGFDDQCNDCWSRFYNDGCDGDDCCPCPECGGEEK
jgi:hypothetical protein